MTLRQMSDELDEYKRMLAEMEASSRPQEQAIIFAKSRIYSLELAIRRGDWEEDEDDNMAFA